MLGTWVIVVGWGVPQACQGRGRGGGGMEGGGGGGGRERVEGLELVCG